MTQNSWRTLEYRLMNTNMTVTPVMSVFIELAYVHVCVYLTLLVFTVLAGVLSHSLLIASLQFTNIHAL